MRSKSHAALVLIICLLFSSLNAGIYSAAAYSVPVDSYDSFKNTVLGKGYDVDGKFGYQCWDGASLLWNQLGMTLYTQYSYYGSGSAGVRTCWENKTLRKINAGTRFTLITDVTDIRRGDVLVFGSSSSGHICFADESYRDGMSRINILGQNQTNPNNTTGHVFDVISMSLSSFLGAFRYNGWNNASIIPGVYTIETKLQPGMVLDIAGGSADNGANLQLYTKNNGSAQKFRIDYFAGGSDDSNGYCISPICSGKYVDVSGNNSAAGTNIQQWEGTGADAQKWFFTDAGDGYYYLRSALGTVMDVVNWETAPGTNIATWTYHGGDCQKFRLLSAELTPDTYFIESKLQSDMVLDIADGSADNGANLQLYTINGSAAQVFSLNYFAGGSDFYNGYYLSPVCSGKFVDVSGNNSAAGTNIQQWDGTGADAQKWFFIDAGDGWYYLRSALGTVMDVVNWETAPGTNIATWSYHGGDNQKYRLLKAYRVIYDANGGSGAPAIQYKAEGKSLTLRSAEPTRSGYTFLGWSADPASSQADFAAGGKYTSDAAVTLYAVWRSDNDPLFSDVTDPDAYYYDAVRWAVNNGITNGTGANTFSPGMNCTRGQVVTFLWRFAGSPEPSVSSTTFTDIAPENYYYKAVLWAAGNGITLGTSETSFSPDMPCTRAHVVTFLWRSQGQPDPVSDLNPFRDVSSTGYYCNAVLWAVENGITNGTSADLFSPGNPCTRVQIVTFLYRAAQN